MMTRGKAALIAVVAIVVMGAGALGYTLAEAGATSSEKVDRAQTRVGLIERLLIDVDGLLASDEIALTPRGERLVEAGMQRSLEALEEARLELRGVRAELMRKRYQVQTQAAAQSWTFSGSPDDHYHGPDRVCDGTRSLQDGLEHCDGEWVSALWITGLGGVSFPGEYVISYTCATSDGTPGLWVTPQDQSLLATLDPFAPAVQDHQSNQPLVVKGTAGTFAARQHDMAPNLQLSCAGAWTLTFGGLHT